MSKQIKVFILMGMDAFFVVVGFFLALLLRYDYNIPMGLIEGMVDSIAVITMLKILIFVTGRLYNSIWKYASLNELLQIFFTIFFANILVVVYAYFVGLEFPRGVYVISGMFDVMLVGGSRIAYRILMTRLGRFDRVAKDKKRIMIVGAGDAGAMLIKELNNHSELNSKPVALIDDDENKKNLRINGVPVYGNTKDIKDAARALNIDEIIIAIPSAGRTQIQLIMDECRQTKAKVKILPGIYEIIGGRVSISQVRDVQIEDLLGREPIKLDTDNIKKFIKYKKILVTGAGGSIGSELCRQILKFQPTELILLDIYENSLYDLQNELNKTYEGLDLKVIIASVRDRDRMEQIIARHRPDVIFHAAAHKHVPLMENNPQEAVRNNVLGTLNMVQLSDRYEVEKFVLISTDKAVNPTNVMGATKRLAEMIVQSMDKVSKSEFVAVRFGNVLGSNGSVIPLFKRQIEQGGPVTLTHPEIIRYFMSIPEATQLVLQAGAMAKGGEIFILDMGEPVKIMDLAKDLIRLSGFEPEEDIPIVITGLRPGEKLYEELLLSEEGISKTVHEKIFIGKPLYTNYDEIIQSISRLESSLSSDAMKIKNTLQSIVKTYKVYEQ
ncbi:MAG TPA: nucleoside-diphosphate sugar epimerase [Eubacteriaceae bacterium]|nr:nucleoside-diphosphate sugar epimerase [Eubacteriaceae bacterium]